MSTPAERADEPLPSFARNLARTLPFMLVCGIVGPIFLAVYFLSGSSDLIGWMLWTGLGVTLLDVVLAVVIAGFRTRSQRRTYRLRQVGRRGFADILSLEQTGVRINDQPLIELHVRVHGPDVVAFETRRKSVIADIQMPLLYAGPVPVLVDPETGEWEFDWDAPRTAPTTMPGLTSSMMPRPAAAAVPDQRPVAERLAELDGLLRQDLLSREEYDAARARILGEI